MTLLCRTTKFDYVIESCAANGKIYPQTVIGYVASSIADKYNLQHLLFERQNINEIR
jgi:hypothetical protein